MIKRASLHTRLVGMLLILSAIAVVFIVVGSSLMAKRIEADISQRNLSLAYAISQEAEHILNRPAEDLIDFAEAFEPYSPQNGVASQLGALTHFSRLFQLVQILDDNGRVILVVPDRKEQVGLDLSRQPFFTKAKENVGLQWTDAFLSGQTNTPLVTISLAFKGGVVAGHINLEVLNEISNVGFPTSTGFICVLDRRGVIIGHSDPTVTLQGVSLLNMQAVRMGLAGKPGTYRDKFNAEEGLSSVSTIKRNGWLVLVFQPEREALGAIRQMETFALLAVALTVLVGLGAISVSRRLLLTPLETLANHTKAVSMGEYDVNVTPEYSEFEELASSFNNMAGKIRERQQAIFEESNLNKAQAEVVRAMTETDVSIDAVSDVVREWALALTRSEFGFVRSIDPLAANDTVHTLSGLYCKDLYSDASGQKVSFPNGLSGYGELWDCTLNAKSAFYTNNPQECPQSTGSPEGRIPLERFLSAPAVYQGELLGQLGLVNAPSDYSDRDLEKVSVLADLFALAVFRMRSHQALVAAKDASETANVAKSEFLANMSHEIRTPLNGVLGMLQILQETALDTVQMDCVRQAVSSGRKLIEVIGDILDMSKIEAGKLLIREDVVNLPKIFKDTVETFLVHAVDKEIDLICRIDDRIPPLFRGDGIRIRQILFNLVGNAVKFTARGEVRVRAFPKGLEPEAEGFDLCFEVSDTGIGIPSDQLAIIFEPFMQVDGSHTRKHGGTGLGMSIVKRLVDLMGGTLHVESEVGVGTTFRVSIPVKVVEGESHAEGKFSAAIPPTEAIKPLPKLRILVAEDDLSNQLVAKRLLGKQGHVVTCAVTGREALTALDKDSFDLVLMDIQMPEMDGTEATREIRKDERFKNLPIIALTAHAMSGDRERFLDAGMDDYLSKPIDIDELKEVLVRVMTK